MKCGVNSKSRVKRFLYKRFKTAAKLNGTWLTSVSSNCQVDLTLWLCYIYYRKVINNPATCQCAV